MSLKDPTTQQELLANVQFSVIAIRTALKLLIANLSKDDDNLAKSLDLQLSNVVEGMKNNALGSQQAQDLAIELLEEMRGATRPGRT